MDPLKTNSPGARLNLDNAAGQALKNKLITPQQFKDLTKPATKPGEMARDLEIGRLVLDKAQRDSKGSRLEIARALFKAAEDLVTSAGDLEAVDDEPRLSAQRQTVLTALEIEAGQRK